jgi:putative ABC transport system substrate-binding protein
MFIGQERSFRRSLRLRLQRGGPKEGHGMSEAIHWSRRQFLRRVALVGASSAAGFLAADCATPVSKRTPRIGVLSEAPKPAILLNAFQKALGDLGYVPGENIAIEYKSARGPDGQVDEDVPPVKAAQLVALNVDLIVTGATTCALAAKNATTTIPIVAWHIGADPVGEGLVASLAHPGGNVTGVMYGPEDSTQKRLALLKQAIPSARRIGGLGQDRSFADHNDTSWWQQSKTAAAALGIELVAVLFAGVDDLERAFDKARTDGVDALIAAPDVAIFSNAARVAALAALKRIPFVFDDRAYVDAGGLMNYGPNFADTWRRTADYVDRILKGAKPADLPVERPSKFDLVINLKTAAALGLTIPPSVLAQATEVLR